MASAKPLADNFESWYQSWKWSPPQVTRTIHDPEKTTSYSPENRQCTLRRLPPEIRDEIFELVLIDFFNEHPDRRTLIYEDFLEPFFTDPFHSEHHYVRGCEKNDKISASREGLQLRELPPLELALISDRKLYREFFSLRLKSSIIELRPSLAWNWEYEYPALASSWDYSYESLHINEPGRGAHYHQFLAYFNRLIVFDIRQDLPDLSGWTLEYPSINSMSPLMVRSVRNLKVVKSPLIEQMLYIPGGWDIILVPITNLLTHGIRRMSHLTKLEMQLNANWLTCFWDRFLTLLFPALEVLISNTKLRTLVVKDHASDSYMFNTSTRRFSEFSAGLDEALGIRGRWVEKPTGGTGISGWFADYDLEEIWDAGKGKELIWNASST